LFEDEIIFPDNIDEASVLSDEMIKTPIHRITLPYESDFSLFNNSKVSYNGQGKISYILSDVQQSDEDPDNVVITISDMDDPDRKFYIETLIQYVNSAFLLSQMVKMPMFFIVPSDDIVGSMGYGPYSKAEVKVVVEAPARKTLEFNRITKILFNLSKHDSSAVSNKIYVSPDIVDNVRYTLVDIILGLIEGKPDSLIKAYSYSNMLSRTNDIEELNNDQLNDEDRFALVMKDLLLKLEHDTHPIAIASLFKDEPGIARNSFIRDIESFENIISNVKFSKKFINSVTPSVEISETSSAEDILAYISSPIVRADMPGAIQGLLMGCEIDYLWEFNWNTVLEINVNFKKVRAGDFFIAMLFVVAVRLSKLNEVYKLHSKSRLAPLATMIASLTSDGESFSWIVKNAVESLADNNDTLLQALLEIPNDLPDRADINGPAGMLLHNIAHAAMDLTDNLNTIEAALSSNHHIYNFVSKVFELRDTLPSEIVEGDEASCFIKGIVLPAMAETFVSSQEINTEMISSLKILSELNVMKINESSINSQEWKKALHDYYVKLF
jgi:hypothetical protein